MHTHHGLIFFVDSFTKEVRLTQDLLRLFLDYQVPSDLLTYDGINDPPDEYIAKDVKIQ